MKKAAIIFLAVVSFLSASGQQYRPMNSVQIYEKLHQLNHLTTVMYLAAHPDDENTRLLSYLVHHEHFKTIYFSLTRGDGGQNLLGNDLGISLGLIRNYELIEARKIDGAEQIFSSYIDFGFTKNPEETFEFWNKQALVDEIKKAVQIYRPDAIICRFPTDGRGGHGQHTASAIAAQEAFRQLEQEAAKNTAIFLPQRVLFNSFRFGDRSTITDDQFKIPTNQYNSLLGESYGELAGRSRSIHRSQGAGTPQSIGISTEHFELLAGKPIVNNIIDRDISWSRVSMPAIEKAIKEVIRKYDFSNPQASLQDLIAVRKQIGKVKDDYWRAMKLKEIDRIILSSMGFMAEIYGTQAEAIQGETIRLKMNIISRANGAKIKNINLPGSAIGNFTTAATLSNDTTFEQEFSIKISDNETITEPYWLANTPGISTYKYDQYFSLPETPNPFAAGIQLEYMNELFTVQVPISYKYLSPTKGDVVQALRIIPDAYVKPVSPIVFFGQDKDITLPFTVQTNTKENGQANINVIKDGKTVHSEAISLPPQGKETMYAIRLDRKLFSGETGSPVTLELQYGGKRFSRYQYRLNYDHLPELVYYPHANIKLIPKVWQEDRQRIGYINGAGDNVFTVLKDMGLHIEMIPDNRLSDLDYLSRYDAIVSGIRAYNTNESLARSNDILMQYVEQGGNYLIQYNTNSNLKTNELGPYSFTLSRDRVTDEKAVVTITDKSAPLLNYPNKISTSDFDNWVQERGLYFPSNVDSRYKTIFRMSDKGENALNNAVIYAPYGKGNYIYTALSFFRQIPDGNIGAIKLFLNMIGQKNNAHTEPR